MTDDKPKPRDDPKDDETIVVETTIEEAMEEAGEHEVIEPKENDDDGNKKPKRPSNKR